MDANGLQNAALQANDKTGHALHSRDGLSHPTTDKSGTTFWFVRSRRRYLPISRKLEPLNPTRGDLVTDVLCNLPLAKAEKLLNDKKLLDEGAVEFLRGKKVLK